MAEPMENINPLETPITPPEKVSKGTMKRLIDFFKKANSVEAFENYTGKPTIPVQDLAAQGKSPISPLDDFMKPKKDLVAQDKSPISPLDDFMKPKESKE